TNSDSALHTSVTNPNAASPFTSPGQTALSHSKRSGLLDGELISYGKALPFCVPPQDSIQDEEKPLPKALWDTRKVQSVTSRPKSCEVPGINNIRPLFPDYGAALPSQGMDDSMTCSPPAQQKDDLWRRATKKGIFPSPDQSSSISHVPSALNTGGSLPDLTNLHFPSLLPTLLDPEDSVFSSISGGNSTGNLTTTMTHLGIRSSLGMASGYESVGGLSSSLQGSLSNMSLQSSLSNPSLQSSLSAQSLSNSSLQSSLSNPSLQSSLSSSSLRTSLSNPSLQSSPSNPSSLQPVVNALSKQSPLSASSLHSSLNSSLPPGSISTSPRRRVPLNPLTLSSSDSRRPHSKPFSPTMSPTLSSITQGIPLDTSNLSMDQRLPPYPFCQQQSQQQQSYPQSQQQGYQASQQSQQQGYQASQQQGYQASQQSQQQGYQASQQQAYPHTQQQGYQQSQQQGYQPSQQTQPSQQQDYQPSQQQGYQPSQQQGYQQSQQQGYQTSQQSQQQGYQSSQPTQQQGYQASQQSQQQGYQASQPAQQQGYQASQQSQQQGYQASQQSQQQGYQASQQSQQQGYQASQPAQQQGYQHQPSQKNTLPQQQQAQPSSPCVQPGACPLSQATILKNLFGDSYFEQHLSSQQTSDLSHQCNMETLVGDLTLNSNVFSGNMENSSFSQADVMGPMDSSESLQDPQLLNKQNVYYYNRMGTIPNIILTGDSPPGFSKEITSALAGVPGFEMDSQYPLNDELKIEPLTLDGLSMLSDPNLTLLSDPAVEDSFRL
ncbi:CREB-regulated transcription coactivator 2-like, partial [Mustelus asterias]